MTAVLLPNGKQDYQDATGAPLVGGKLRTFDAGTNNPRPTFADAGMLAANTNPVILDARGEAVIFWSGAYKVELSDANDVIIWTVDGIQGVDVDTQVEEAIDALKDEFANTADPALGDALVGTKMVRVTGGIPHTQHEVNEWTVNVFKFMPPDKIADVQSGIQPLWDATPYINLATSSTLVFGGNVDAPKRRIVLPAGNWRINGPVYVRKGQLLEGEGIGATRIYCPDPNIGTDTFILGSGFVPNPPPNGPPATTQDPGGLPPCIRNLHFEGSPLGGAAVRVTASGAMVEDLFLTSCAIGILVDGGSDITISNCFIDQGLNGIILNGSQSVVLDHIQFFLCHFQITLQSGAHDVQIQDCHFNFAEFSSILIPDAAPAGFNILVSGCQFLLNEQFATNEGFIVIRTGTVEITIDGCVFRNMKGYAINHATGIGAVINVSNCVFDGLKSFSGYADQSTTAGGILLQNDRAKITNCIFRNLFTSFPIQWQGAFQSNLEVFGCNYYSIAAASFINIANTSDADSGNPSFIYVHECVGDDVKPLINLQHSIYPKLKGNRSWLGAAVNAGGRLSWSIPTFWGSLIKIGMAAGTNPTGNRAYSKVISELVARTIDFTAGNPIDQLTTTILMNSPSGFALPIDLLVAFDAVGGPVNPVYVNRGRYVVMSVPNNYIHIDLQVDYEAG